MNTGWLLIPLLASGAGAALAADDAATPDAAGFVDFERLDSDRNGYVSRVEARSIKAVEAVFDTADRNRDGLLDVAEYRRARSTAEGSWWDG